MMYRNRSRKSAFSVQPSRLWTAVYVRHRKHDDQFNYGSLHLTEQVLWMRATAPFAGGDSRVSVRGGFLRDF